ncbi:hypothetical protein FGG08_005348 [Glutinoglossum americanum]|uniref:ADP-ribosylation factor-binding protein GGA1 n=1 Tax=Glutinoglossum americanum TaxID=1670608 RepID=A0A9P8L1I0_9PEZI|nr:hypothetical protein FGG08_005348 [Glutinoglossum americanum]
MAARDRFGTHNEPGPSQLQRYIQSACDPANFEPNLALDLEIADLINSKKGNAPREAAVAIVNYINHRNQNVSLLALALLDICVKNCGYPFHLQISTKEFLNELVRRFPERPPLRPTRVQLKILEAIEEWRQTICQTSRHKEDLGFIRDMHRLLKYKGYLFPEVKREDAAVLNPSDNLKSAEEMEEEERAAQSAKLQELIRRGSPEDLQEANRLMKVMAGYDTKNKTDYRAKAAEEVGKIQQKARLLEEMLETFQKGDKIAEGDVFEELANALQSAQPKIQKMCEEESDDSEAVAKLFEINDSIHRTIERYKLVKKGDLDGASKIPKGTLGSTTGVTKGDDNELSLIDLGGDEPSPNGAGKSPAPNGRPKIESLEEDLLGLSFQDSTYGQSGGIALGFGANTNLPGPPLLSSTLQHSSAKPPTPSISPSPQVSVRPSQPQSAKPDYSAFPTLPSSRPPSSRGTQAAPQFQQQSAQAQPTTAAFPAFTSPAQHQTSPFQFLQQHPQSSAPPSLLDLAQQSQSQNISNADAEEWTFASSLPVANNAPPSTNEIIVTNSSVHVLLEVKRPPTSEATIEILARFSNNTSQSISDMTFQVAVTKGISLRLEPQSGRFLASNQKDGITQIINVNGVERGKGSTVKMRWKLSYNVAQSERREEQGEITALGVA